MEFNNLQSISSAKWTQTESKQKLYPKVNRISLLRSFIITFPKLVIFHTYTVTAAQGSNILISPDRRLSLAKQGSEQSHPDVHSSFSLPEVRRSWVCVHVNSDLLVAWQRVQKCHTSLGLRQQSWRHHEVPAWLKAEKRGPDNDTYIFDNVYFYSGG